MREEINFTEVRRQVSKGQDLLFIVGNTPCPSFGETLRLQVEWIADSKFGREFKVESYLSILLANIMDIEKNMGSRLMKGIRPIISRMLVSEC